MDHSVRLISFPKRTVLNDSGWAYFHIAVLVPDGAIGALVSEVEIHASDGTQAIGVPLRGYGTRVTLQNVTAVAEQASDQRWGLMIVDATAKLIGGTFVGSGGSSTFGIENYFGALMAVSIAALATSGTNGWGVFNRESDCISFITQRVLEGDEYSVRALGSPTVTVTHTSLRGPVSGTCTCLAVSEDTTFYTSTSP